ncbi:MAG: TIR domain-containing protein [Actinomycetota bacterium]|nr:TIR domain-containing protein [Actinomycetota bacterium]
MSEHVYDAFVSYSHAEDRGVAQRLRAGMERFAKPWYRPRALRIFLDVSSLAAEPALWPSVERALGSAKWFVLVTSPSAAGSKWVNREIHWWLANRPVERLLVVVADGSLAWDEDANDFNADTSSALPPALRGAFSEEPRWVTVPPSASGNPEPSEAEMRGTVVDVAATIRGVGKEELEGDAVRERQRTRRWVVGTISSLSLLLLLAVVASLVALSQRASAIDQAHVATSRQVATLSERVAGRNLNVAIQLAATAYRIDANPQTRAALINANTTSPSLIGFLQTESPVTHLAGSKDGRFAVAGLEDGSVLRWRLGKRRPRLVFRVRDEALAVAISRDGSTVAAAGTDGVTLWRDGQVGAKLPVPKGLEPVAAGLSPSGRTLVFTAGPPDFGEGLNAAIVASTADPGDRVIHWESPGGAPAVSVASDRRALFDYGNWKWRNLESWSGKLEGVGVGAHDFAHTASADGRFWTVTNGAERVEVWSTERDPSAGPTGAVEVPLAEQTGLALSPDGSTLAVAGSGEVYVAAVTPVEESREEEARRQAQFGDGPVALTGQEADLLAFADDTHLLTATGNEIGVWDTEQLDRLADSERVPLGSRCTLCGGPTLRVSPDGKRLAAISGLGGSAFVQSLVGPPEREVLPGDGFDFSYGAPVWRGDGDLVAFPVWGMGGGLDLSSLAGLPADIRAWSGGGGSGELGEGEMINAAAPDGDSAIVIDETDTIYWQDLETGAVEDVLPGPPDAEGVGGSAAINADADLLVTLDEEGVAIEDLRSRRVVSRMRFGKDLAVNEVVYAGPRLLIQLSDDSLQVWDKRGETLQRTIANGRGEGMQGNADGTLVAMARDDGMIALFDLDTGAQIGSFQTPGHSTFFKSGIAFTPDGEHMVTLSESPDESSTGVLVQRDLSDRGLLRAACRAVGPPLTAAQWRSFVGGDPPVDLSCQ